MFCSHDAPTGVSPLKDSDGKTYSDRETKANILNKQFSSVFNTNEDKSTIPDKGPSPHPTMGPIEITENAYLPSNPFSSGHTRKSSLSPSFP
jgi:hypothetical protein